MTDHALGGWYTLTIETRGIVHEHAIPHNDYRPHHCTPEGDCWCHPAHDEEADLFTHAAMDGRTEYEQGRALQ